MNVCCVDERDGLAQSLHQSEQLVQDKQATISQLDGQTAALQSEISSLKQNKDDVSFCYILLHLWTTSLDGCICFFLVARHCALSSQLYCVIVFHFVLHSWLIN